MRKIVFLVYAIGIPSLLIFPATNAYAEHIFEDTQAFGQYLDVAQLGAEKYPLTIDENEFVIYYGWGGSLEPDVEELKELVYPTVSTMKINQERKSLEVTFEQVSHENVMWIRIPFDLLTAEGEKFQLIIDGRETQYDLTRFPNAYAVGMILPADTKNLEIIGTNVIPEFGTFSIAILGVTIFAVLFAFRGKSRFFNYN